MKKKLVAFLCILAGNALLAFAVCNFIVPNDFMMGGSNGIAFALHTFIPLPLSAINAILNGLLFFLGLGFLGKKFAAGTLLSTIAYPGFMAIFERFPLDALVSEDKFICALFGAVIIGFGVGIVIRAGGATGGMDIPPLVLKKRFGIPVSASMYFFDAVILVGQMPFGDKERILYALIMVMVYTMVLDKVLMMGSKQIQVKIFSAKYEEISKAIQEKMDRGTTLLNMEGGHSRQKSMAILSIVSGRELSKINDIVMEIDENAFMIVNQVGEVRGRGFTMTKKYE